MNIEEYRTHCLSKRGVAEEFPFGEETMVFKVRGKMFSLAGVDPFERISVKVVPETGVELREKYDSVVPAYHMNKKHWVNVIMDGSIPDRLVKEWIDNSYELVVAGLTVKERKALGRF